jgi:hypothetical protein
MGKARRIVFVADDDKAMDMKMFAGTGQIQKS